MRWVVIIGLLVATAACVNSGSSRSESIDATYIAQAATARAASSATVLMATPDASPKTAVVPTMTTTATVAMAEPTAAASPSPTTEPTATATVEPPPPPVYVSGTGTGSSPVFELAQGLAVLVIRHDGAEQFTMRMYDSNGGDQGEIAAGPSPWTGSRALLIPVAGGYQFDVAADGPWSVEITRPIPPDAPIEELPFERSGTGTTAIYFVKVPAGLHKITATHDGQSTFGIALIDAAGTTRDRVFFLAGPFNGSGAVTVSREPFDYLVIDVRADGNWTVRIE